MITVKALKEGISYSLEIEGHACHSKKNDVVCAGVSAIYYALAAFAAQDRRVKTFSHSEKSGSGKIQFTFSEKRCDFFMMAVKGLSLISESYPENVRIIYRKKKG